MFFKALDSRRIEKIYNFAKSSSIGEFKKYLWNWVIVKGSDNFPVKLKFYEMEGSNGNISLPHLMFFMRLFKEKINDGDTLRQLEQFKEGKILCGNGDLKVYGANYG